MNATREGWHFYKTVTDAPGVECDIWALYDRRMISPVRLERRPTRAQKAASEAWLEAAQFDRPGSWRGLHSRQFDRPGSYLRRELRRLADSQLHATARRQADAVALVRPLRSLQAV